jgi:hypothetical protein
MLGKRVFSTRLAMYYKEIVLIGKGLIGKEKEGYRR